MESHRLAVTANTLPDDVLREIFAFCLSSYRGPFNRHGYKLPIKHMTGWQRLVQVCRKWRHIIYGSPCYLDLHLYYSYPFSGHRRVFRENLRRWPKFPIIVNEFVDSKQVSDNVIEALEHPDRVDRVHLSIEALGSGAREVLEAMEAPFPALTYLDLAGPACEEAVWDLPDRFLGGSAPCLQHLRLTEISYPALPKLLLSARGLVTLELDCTPASGYGYISPEAIVGGLAGLTKLRTLCIKFSYPDPLDWDERLEKTRHPDPPMHAVLPALTEFTFKGESRYLEDLMAQIDTPRLEDIDVVFFTVEIETRQLYQFLGRIPNLDLKQFKRAQVMHGEYYVTVQLDRPRGESHQVRFCLSVKISCMARVLGRLFATLSDVDHLTISKQTWHGGDAIIKNIEWLPLLHLFPVVKVLRVYGDLAEHITTVLEDIAEETVTKVLPALRLLWLEVGDKPVGSTERFLSSRQRSGHPVTLVKTLIKTQDEFVG